MILYHSLHLLVLAIITLHNIICKYFSCPTLPASSYVNIKQEETSSVLYSAVQCLALCKYSKERMTHTEDMGNILSFWYNSTHVYM